MKAEEVSSVRVVLKVPSNKHGHVPQQTQVALETHFDRLDKNSGLQLQIEAELLLPSVAS